MKKVLVLLLALIMVFALAACGEEKEADVIAGTDAKDTVIETPTAAPQQPIINEVTTTQTPEYTNVEVLPTTAPTANPNPGAVSVTSAPATSTPGTGTGTAVSVPIPTKDPNAVETQTVTQTGGNEATGNDDNYEITFADDHGEMYYPTATQEEKNNAKTGYTNVQHANFRVGPGTQYKIYESLRKGAEVKVISIEGDWAKVWYDGHMLGYVYKDYISYGVSPAVAPDPATGGSAEIIITP